MSTNKSRERTLIALTSVGISLDDARALCRAERTLHTWAEHECNGAIQRDERTGRPYWHSTHTGRQIGRTADRERGAIARVRRILAAYPGLAPYFQGDPRGCALYVIRPGDVPAGADVDGHYSRGLAVTS
jgi:hypothetical protein